METNGIGVAIAVVTPDFLEFLVPALLQTFLLFGFFESLLSSSLASLRGPLLGLRSFLASLKPLQVSSPHSALD